MPGPRTSCDRASSSTAHCCWRWPLAWGWGVTHRSTFIAEVLRDRNALYRIIEDGAIENAYTLKLVNKTDAPAQFHVTIEGGPAGAQLRGAPVTVAAPAGEVVSIALQVNAPAGTSGRHALGFDVSAEGIAQPRRIDSSFFAPP